MTATSSTVPSAIALAQSIESKIIAMGDAALQKHCQSFFKTRPGEYGEGDIFCGVKVPPVRALAKKHKKEASLPIISALLDAKVHEVRFAGLVFLSDLARDTFRKNPHCALHDWQEPLQMGRKSQFLRSLPVAVQDCTLEDCMKLYLARQDAINNWDLVDISAPWLLGPLLAQGEDGAVWALAKTGELWKERVAIVATLYTARQGMAHYSLALAEYFLGHEHDLIHKACGWVLREAGKKAPDALLSFLDAHAALMPRTMLRYAIERQDTGTRARYMAAK